MIPSRRVDPSGQDDSRPLAEEKRRSRQRSLAIALTLGFLVLLLYVVTIAKLGPQVVVRPL